MTKFTPEDLLLYLYKESSHQLTEAIEQGLKLDWTLTGKTHCIKSIHAKA